MNGDTVVSFNVNLTQSDVNDLFEYQDMSKKVENNEEALRQYRSKGAWCGNVLLGQFLAHMDKVNEYKKTEVPQNVQNT